MSFLLAGPIFTEWYWVPVGFAIVFGVWLAFAGSAIIFVYWIFFAILRIVRPQQPRRFMTKKKVIIAAVLIVAGFWPFANQASYIEANRAHPDAYPCLRILCLDNFFPVTVPASHVDTSAITFKVYRATPPPRGFKEPLWRINSTDDGYASWGMVEGQSYLYGAYRKGSSIFDLSETQLTAAESVDYLRSRYNPEPLKTPKGRVVYEGGNTAAVTIIGGTVIHIGGYHVNADGTLSPELASLVDSLQGVPVGSLRFKP